MYHKITNRTNNDYSLETFVGLYHMPPGTCVILPGSEIDSHVTSQVNNDLLDVMTNLDGTTLQKDYTDKYKNFCICKVYKPNEEIEQKNLGIETLQVKKEVKKDIKKDELLKKDELPLKSGKK